MTGKISFYCRMLGASRQGFYKYLANKVLTGLIAVWTGSTFDTAKDNLPTGIGLLTMISVNTEIFGIIEGSFVIPVRKAMSLYFFGDGSRILTQKSGDIFKRSPFIQFIFNVNTVIQSKVFLVTGDISAHVSSFYCCQKER